MTVLTFKEWVWFVVAASVFMGFVAPSRADVMHCVHRGKLAASMVYAVSEGYDLDKVNVNFRIAPRSAAELADRDQYVEEVRKEVAGLLQGQSIPARDTEFANAIGMKVAEACAFKYGKERGFMKEVGTHIDNEAPIPADEVLAIRELRRIGSTPPMTEEQASELILGTASSTSIEGPPIGMAEACSNLKYDIKLIARAMSEGAPKEKLIEVANNSLEQLGTERLARILAMIEEAYAHEGPIVEWMNRRYAECMGNR
jgi:hypothetical protein